MQSKNKKFHIKNIYRHFFVILILNLPMYIFGLSINMPGSIFTYSNIFSLLILSYFRIVGILFLFLFNLIEIFYRQSEIYYFTSFDFFRSLSFTSKINLFYSFYDYTIYIIISFFLFIVMIAMFFWKKIKNEYSFLYFIFFGFFIISLDNVNGSSHFSSTDKDFEVPVNIIGSAEYAIFKEIQNRSNYIKLKKISGDQSILLQFQFADWASKNDKSSIVFIIAESFGIPKSEKSFLWLKEITKIKKYKTVYSDVEFKGSTTNGELRSLCALEGHYTSVNMATSENCLPAQLLKNGWSTSGFHGFSGYTFDRHLWWSKIGLENTYFDENSTIEKLPRCGNMFRGACDKDLIHLAFRAAYRPKSFIYLLSLNTHLPVIKTPIPSDLAQICRQDSIPTKVCTHIAALGRLLANVAKEASIAPKSPLIVVVGDHAPPFTAQKNREFFLQDKVPSFILIPE